MPTRYVRVVPSSGPAGSLLSSEIAQAFERIRERAYAIYDSRLPDIPGSEYEDWLQAERELFEVPEFELSHDENVCCLILQAEAAADRPLTVAVEPMRITILGHSMADGEICLFRVVNLPEAVDPERADVVIRRGSGVEIVLAKAGVPAEPAEEPKAMAAAAGCEVVTV